MNFNNLSQVAKLNCLYFFILEGMLQFKMCFSLGLQTNHRNLAYLFGFPVIVQKVKVTPTHHVQSKPIFISRSSQIDANILHSPFIHT